MELTREEALRLHRELWNWLSENPDKVKLEWPGWEDPELEEIGRDHAHCFACAVVAVRCSECLLQWPNHDTCYGKNGEGLFSLWFAAQGEKQVRLARQIRDLPVREV